MKPIPSATSAHIISLLQSGRSTRQIAAITHVSKTTVSDIAKRHLPGLIKAKGGRPSKLSEADVRHAIRLITTGKADTAVQVARRLRDISNMPVSTQTIRNHLRRSGLKALVKKRKPLLTRKLMKDRLDFALAHQHWTVDDWKRVVWSDETKINRIGSDGRNWVWNWREKQKRKGLTKRDVNQTLKFGGGHIMVWGCMLWQGTGLLVRIDGNMDAELYTKILQEDLVGSLKYYYRKASNILFQHDNNRKHTSKMATSWLQEHGFEVLVWPSQSPDLNPIEHLWAYIKRRLQEYDTPPKGILELWERVAKEWNAIPKKVCQDLIESMPSRIQKVIEAKGGWTKY